MSVHVHVSLSFYFLALFVVIMSLSTLSLVRALHPPSMQWRRFLSLGKSSDRIYRIRNEPLNGVVASGEPEQPVKPKTKQTLLRSKLLKNLKTAGSGSAMTSTNELVNSERMIEKTNFKVSSSSSSSSSSSRKTTSVSGMKIGGMKMEAQAATSPSPTDGIDVKAESDRPFTLPPGRTLTLHHNSQLIRR